MNSISDYKAIYTRERGFTVWVVREVSNYGLYIDGADLERLDDAGIRAPQQRYDFSFPAGGTSEKPKVGSIVAMKLTQWWAVQEFYVVWAQVTNNVHQILTEGESIKV